MAYVMAAGLLARARRMYASRLRGQHKNLKTWTSRVVLVHTPLANYHASGSFKRKIKKMQLRQGLDRFQDPSILVVFQCASGRLCSV